MWFEVQDAETQKYVKYLIASRRFEMVGGGWVQNDEASSSYTSIIDQMTVGHQYLLERFGIRPKVAWQIDPFGHGGVSAQLYADMGFDALIINRVHHRIKRMMKNSQALEFIWKNGENSIFTHCLHTHYAAVQGFDFEDRVPIIEDYNLAARANVYVDAIKQRSSSYKSNYVMVPFGDDFKFQQASHQFANMDKLINHINADPKYGVKIRYATVSDYIYALNTNFQNLKYPVIRHDFFPYADNDDSYWTGHFSSLPNLKQKIRKSEAQLRSSENSLAFGRIFEREQNLFLVNWIKLTSYLQSFRENVAVTQHHDAITGTCRSHVADNYMNLIQPTEAQLVETEMLTLLLKGNSPQNLQKINDVILEPSKKYSLVVHNAESNERIQLIYVKSKTQVISILSQNEKIKYQVIPNLNENEFSIFFEIKIKGFSIIKYDIKTMEDITNPESISKNTIYLSTGASPPKSSSIRTVNIDSSITKIDVSNQEYIVTFDKNSGYISSIKDLKNKGIHAFKNQFLEFQTQRSGSYIFRPASNPQTFSNSLKSIYISHGSLLSQAIVTTERLTQTIRLFKNEQNSDFMEVVYDLRPIPGNTEMVTRIGVNANGKKGDVYSFDGLKFMKRFILDQAPLAGKYYPSVAGALYRFPDSSLIVLTEHSMAFTATSDELEFMIHRRLNSDDGRGMSQANADQSPFRFKMFIQLKSFKAGEAHGVNMIKVHQKSHELNNPITSYISKSNKFKTKLNLFEPIGMLNYASDDFVLRIQNLSPTKPTSFKISDIFDPKVYHVTSIREKSLNLIYDVPHGKSILDYRVKWNEGEHALFDFTSKVEKAGSDDSQNTDEEGVFLSTAALEEKSTGGRRVLSLAETKEFSLKPGSIGTYLISLELVNNHKGVLIVNGDKEPKEKEAENDKDDEEEKPKDDTDLYQDQHKIPKINVDEPIQIGKKATPDGEHWNNLMFGFIFIFIAISFCLYFMFCRRKTRSTILPMTKNEVKDQ